MLQVIIVRSPSLIVLLHWGLVTVRFSVLVNLALFKAGAADVLLIDIVSGVVIVVLAPHLNLDKVAATGLRVVPVLAACHLRTLPVRALTS